MALVKRARDLSSQATLRGLAMAREFRARGKTVVMGGYMASMMSSYVGKYVDSVVVGDAEISYPRLLEDFERTGTVKPLYDNPVTSLEGLPVPRYELLLEKKTGGMLPVQAGRAACTAAASVRSPVSTREDT